MLWLVTPEDHTSGQSRFAGLRMKKAHVTHPELKVTLHLDIIGVKKNPNGQSYTQLGVLTKGTIIEVNVSELGLVTPGGKVVWGKYAQARFACCFMLHNVSPLPQALAGQTSYPSMAFRISSSHTADDRDT